MFLRVFILFLTGFVLAEKDGFQPDLFTKSLEELLETRITTLTKGENLYSKLPASVQVLTEADLATYPGERLTDVLRSVLGAQAFDIDKNDKIFSLRGSASQFSNKLQVLINGQSITSFPFSGVFWSEFDIPLSWIERIEIIKGQHGSLWGSNNVNGIVNIILKNPRSQVGGGSSWNNSFTLGFLSDKPRVDVVSNQAVGSVNLTFLGNINSQRDSEKTEYGPNNPDDDSVNSRFGILATKDFETWKLSTNLFRFDSSKNRTVLKYYPYVENQIYQGSGDFGATLFSLNAERDFQGGKLVLSYDLLDTTTDYSFVGVDDLTQSFSGRFVRQFNDDSRLTIGGSFRHVDEEARNTDFFAFLPTNRTFLVRRVYSQIEQDFFNDRGIGILSAAVERNSFTGSNVPYNLRFGYSLTDKVFSWMSLGKAYRLPSRIERDMVYAFRLFEVAENVLIPGVLYGNNRVLDESAVGVEVGSRLQLVETALLDLTVFKYWYDNLVTFSARPELVYEPLYESVAIPIDVKNNATSTAYGAEALVKWFGNERFRLEAGYAFFYASSELSEDFKNDVLFVEPELRAPKHAILARPVFSFGDLTIDAVTRYWSPNLFNSEGPLWTLDLGLTYEISERDSIKILSRNLIKTNDLETKGFAGYTVTKDVPREFGIYYTRRF